MTDLWLFPKLKSQCARDRKVASEKHVSQSFAETIRV